MKVSIPMEDEIKNVPKTMRMKTFWRLIDSRWRYFERKTMYVVTVHCTVLEQISHIHPPSKRVS